MRVIPRTVLITLIALATVRIEALDPPHDSASSIQCASCHLLHRAPGGTITRVAGNPNLCTTCHNAAGQASAKPFANSDKAKPGVSGTSHRWDSGPSGWVEADGANTSTGTIRSGGTYSGRIERTYTMTIAVTGNAGSDVQLDLHRRWNRNRCRDRCRGAARGWVDAGVRQRQHLAVVPCGGSLAAVRQDGPPSPQRERSVRASAVAKARRADAPVERHVGFDVRESRLFRLPQPANAGQDAVRPQCSRVRWRGERRGPALPAAAQ